MDLTTPIDIQAVIGAVKKHKDLLVTLDAEEAGDILKHFTPIPGVKDSITLGRTTLGKISHKYTGHFVGQVSNGKIVPRTLKVYPCVMEMDDEPERYRRTYITEVKGGLYPKEHPFEIWLNNYGIKCASKELHDVILIAKYDSDAEKPTWLLRLTVRSRFLKTKRKPVTFLKKKEICTRQVPSLVRISVPNF